MKTTIRSRITFSCAYGPDPDVKKWSDCMG